MCFAGSSSREMLSVPPLLPCLAGISLCWAFHRAALLLGSAGCPQEAQGDGCSWQLGMGHWECSLGFEGCCPCYGQLESGAWAGGAGENLMGVGWEM